MKGYLVGLIAQAQGAEPTIQPRLRMQFEPERDAIDTLAETNVEVVPAPVTVDHRRTETVRPTDDPRDLQPHARAPSQNNADSPIRPAGVERVAHTRIVERVERVERLVPIPGAPQAPGTVVAREPRATERTVERRVVEPSPLTVVEKSRAMPLPLKPESPHAAREAATPPDAAGKTNPPAAASDVPAAQHAALVAEARVAPPERYPSSSPPQTEAAPEITITIGVLDIRLTQDAEPTRGKPASRAARADTPLALADYLAKRAGGAS